MKKILILFLLVLGFTLRLYKIDNPIADWHSFRQADTSSVTRNYVQNGLNLLKPTYHDLSNIQSGKDNPNGFRMVEMPLYNALHYYTYKAFPSLGLDKAGRLTSVILSTGSILLVILIGSFLSGFFVGWLAGFFMAVLPFNVYYSRVVLPEPLMIFLLLLSYYLLIISSEKTKLVRHILFLASAISLAGAILVKPFTVFFALPHLAYAIRTLARQDINIFSFLAYGLISVTPFYLWRKHIQSFPTGIPASDWLLNSNGIRFRPAWFRWLFGERIGNLILGVYGSFFLILGLISKPLKEGIAYWLWAIGIFAYFSIVAGGNVQHDYYQTIIIPFICFFLAKGVVLVISLNKTVYSRFLTIITTLLVVGVMLSLSWYHVKGYYQVNNWPIVEAGKRVAALTPAGSLVIAPYNGDTAFLYQTERSGWPLGYDIEDKIKKGATHYVSVSYDDEPRVLEKKYTVLEKTDKYIIIDLTKIKQ